MPVRLTRRAPVPPPQMVTVLPSPHPLQPSTVTAMLPATLDVPLRLPASEQLPMTPQTGPTLPAVWACVEVITNTALEVPVVCRRDGQQVPTPEWLRQPERYNGGAARIDQLVEHLVTGQALHGAGYLWAEPIGDSWALDPVDPARVAVNIEPDSTGRPVRVYRLDGQQVLPARRLTGAPSRAGLVVVPHRVLPGVPAGVGPIQAARLQMGSYLDVDGYGADVFGQGIPQGILSTDQELTETQATRYRDRWIEDGRIPVRVLGSGLHFNALRLNPKDAAWLEARRYNAEEVARMYGVPAYKLNLTAAGGMVYSNAESLDGDFLRGCVSGGYLRPVEAALNQLTPAGRGPAEELRVTFDYTHLLRATTDVRFKAYSDAIAAGWMTPDEVRAIEGLPPMTERPEQVPA